MVGRREAGAALDLGDRFVETAFERRRSSEVLHLPARRADQMMVVLGEILSQLEPGETGAGDDAMDGTCLLEDGEVAIRGALGQVAAGDEVGDGQRLRGRIQPFDDGATARGVTLTGGFEPRAD